jgi:excinuclease ABC subunit C
VRGGRVRCPRDDDRQGARHLRRRSRGPGLQRTYGAASPSEIPRQVLVPTLPDDAAELEQWLQERRGKRVSLQVAQRGRKADLLRTATINAQQALILHKTRRTSDYTARTKALTDLQLALGMDEAPLRIECYDVSHLSGPTSWHPWWSSKTACRARISTAPSVFGDDRRHRLAVSVADASSRARRPRRRRRRARPPPRRRRRTDAESPVVTERKRPRFAYRPQLLVVDGGAPQVAAAAAPSRTPATRDRPLRHREATRGDLAAGEDYPVILPRTSEALYLLQRLRDEAHRFAITHSTRPQARHHDCARRCRDSVRRGSSAPQALRLRCGARASVAEITALPGIGPKLAAAIEQRLAKAGGTRPRGSKTAPTR